MSENGVFKAEFVYIGSDIDEKEPGDRGSGLAREEVVPRLETHSQLKLPADHMIQGPPTPPPVTVPSENTVHILVNQSIAFKPTGLETVNKKVQSIDHHEHENLPDDKVWSKVFLNQVTNKRIIPLTDHKTQLLATPASSKESVLSEDWSGPRIISSEGSQASLSRTVSPCSSVKSGVFSPSVIRVKRHTLVPGSSLAWNSHPCLSPASNSPTPSPCPLSPSLEKARHRPPPTQLTLLTAILRKGRLPILSPVQQRAYSPCWPISEVSLSSCTACNAASKLAPVCPSVAWGQSHSALELHQRTSWHTHMLGPMSQSLSCLTPPPSPDLTAESTAFEPHDQSLNSTDSALERVTSPALKDHPASLRSPSNVKIASSPALQNASNPLNTEETLPCASNPVLSSSFSRLRSLSPKGSSPCPCATGESSSLSPVPKLTSSPVPRSDKKYTLPVPSMVSKLTFSPELRCDDTHTSPAPSPVPELTCSPVHRCDKKYTSPSQSVVSKFSCSPELRCDEAHASPIPSPKPRSTGSPEMMCDKAHTSPIPSPVPELTCSPVPRCEKKYTSSVSSSMTKTTCSSKSRCSEARSLPSLHNCVKVSPPPCLRPPTSQFSPAPRALSLSPSPYASPQSLCALSPLFDSRSSTLERLTLTPSPAPSSRDLLTPSPSLSTSSTPSPIPTSITDKAGRRRKVPCMLAPALTACPVQMKC
ncbi:hypothetical protein JZ751_010876 [Albula glossodonta]|uniref:Uncharacterized protein n=1 Tax=Albula glossodonta TaxID=121402 RepID=A0A8T2P6C0_9TELE|nr:hypothetical protein JZ751_010876 [Albula glossodonta]